MKKYIFYAIGEIMLVVIGILLALQINNWNEERIEKNRLINIFQIINNDINRDTISLNRYIVFYNKRKDLYDRFIRGPRTDSLLIQSFDMINTYQPFNINDKGYDLLKLYTSDKSQLNDSLVDLIIDSYKYYDDLIPIYMRRIEDDIFKNMNEWKNNQEWFLDYANVFRSRKISDAKRKSFNQRFLIYARSNEKYNNKVAMQSNLDDIYLRLFTGFKSRMQRISKAINDRYEFQ